MCDINRACAWRVIRSLGSAAVACVLIMSGPALADPCDAIPAKGRLPDYLARGALFSGAVAYVADGDGICVEVGPHGASSGWVEVRLEDFYAPELRDPGGPQAKAIMERLTRGRQVKCLSTGRKTYDRVVAVCRFGGISLGDRMRRAGVGEGGNAFRPTR